MTSVPQDPFWTDPKVVQGILTIVAAIVASGTALIVAFFAYPHQKNLDRQNEIMNERREVYRRFARTCDEARAIIILGDILNIENKREAVLKLQTLTSIVAELGVTAPDAVVQECYQVPKLFASVAVLKSAKRQTEDDADYDDSLSAAEETTSDENIKEAEATLERKYGEAMLAMRNDSFPLKNSTSIFLERFSNNVTSIVSVLRVFMK